jgi:outer membrane protein assembly factor BamB
MQCRRNCSNRVTVRNNVVFRTTRTIAMKVHAMISLTKNLRALVLCSICCTYGTYSIGDEIDTLWPQWRGSSGQGISNAKQIPVQWSDTTNVRWKVKTIGRGYSSPVIIGNQIWLTTAIETAASAEAAALRLKSNTGDQPLTLLEQAELKALCYDRNSGKLLHDISLLTVKDPQWVHKLNSYASPTPFLEGTKLYCHFGSYGTACLDIGNQKVDWVNTELSVMHENGPGGSPIVIGNCVVFHMDGSDKQYIVALDKSTGKVAWKTDRSGEMHANPQLKKSYGTPVIVTINGKEQIISAASNWLYSYDPTNGSELWKVPYGQLGFSLTPRPVIGNGHIYCITGFGKGQILAIKYADVPTPEVSWRFARGTPTMPSPLLVDRYLYFISDNGVFTCLDAITGEEKYRERLSGNFSSSLWFADGKLFISNREGVTYVLQPGETFMLLAKNELPDAIFATPAAIGKSIYLRTEEHLYCIE